MRDESGPFSLTPANVPFAIVPGLVLMFTLAPAAAPAVPLPLSGLMFGFLGAVLGLVTYRAVRGYGPLARIGALTALCAVLAAVSLAFVRAGG
jgi:hypothetical protein